MLLFLLPVAARLAGKPWAAKHEHHMRALIPGPVISVIAESLSGLYTHAEIDSLLAYSGAPGDPPPGNKIVKVQEWLRRTNKDDSVDPLAVLGRVVEPFMDAEPEDTRFGTEMLQGVKERLTPTLARCGLQYVRGGIVTPLGVGVPSRTFEELIRARSLVAVDEEFVRALRNVEANPREAVSAACNTLEAICKVFIAAERLDPPARQDLQGVWGVVRKALGFDPSAVEDRDLREILSGLLAVVGGIGALRTHASSAHGAGPKAYRLEPRHARLAIHAAHTIGAFILESWDKKLRSDDARST